MFEIGDIVTQTITARGITGVRTGRVAEFVASIYLPEVSCAGMGNVRIDCLAYFVVVNSKDLRQATPAERHRFLLRESNNEVEQ